MPTTGLSFAVCIYLGHPRLQILVSSQIVSQGEHTTQQQASHPSRYRSGEYLNIIYLSCMCLHVGRNLCAFTTTNYETKYTFASCREKLHMMVIDSIRGEDMRKPIALACIYYYWNSVCDLWPQECVWNSEFNIFVTTNFASCIQTMYSKY